MADGALERIPNDTLPLEDAVDFDRVLMAAGHPPVVNKSEVARKIMQLNLQGGAKEIQQQVEKLALWLRNFYSHKQ